MMYHLMRKNVEKKIEGNYGRRNKIIHANIIELFKKIHAWGFEMYFLFSFAHPRSNNQRV